MKKAIVLLSSGLDSTVNLLMARREYNVALALTFDYGQCARKKEIEHAALIAKKYSIPHEVVVLDWLQRISTSKLNTDTQNIPKGPQVRLDDAETSRASARAVWVPNRNGVLLNIAAAYAEALQADVIVPGFNKEEAATFPDNSAQFLHAVEQSFSFSTLDPQVSVRCFTTQMDKRQIVEIGKELAAPFELMWPCYFGGEQLCGECESCQRFNRAVAAQ